LNDIHQKDCIQGMSELQDDSIDCIITSPPYNKTGITGKNNLKIGNQIWNKFNIIIIFITTTCQKMNIKIGWFVY